MLVFLFWVCLILLLYIYLGYPALVWLLSMVWSRDPKKADQKPFLTVLIAAYNEERDIARTLDNKLGAAYPRELMEIIVVSDGSTDRTDKIVRSYADRGVRLIRQEPREGKTAALNRAVPEARGDILVFSDANSLYEPGAIKALVRNFADPSVGYVTGKMLYETAEGSAVGGGCSAYMRYENCMRRWETRVGSIVGVDGGIDAVRSTLWRPMRPDQLPDFVLPLRVVEQGFRVVYEADAVLREPALTSSEAEFAMRARVSLRAFWALWDMRRLLSPLAYGVFSWQLLSHKVLRYLAFLFQLGLAVSSVVLAARGASYALVLVLQVLLYALAFLGRRGGGNSIIARLAHAPYYLTLINAAAGLAFLKFLAGEKRVLWTPRAG